MKFSNFRLNTSASISPFSPSLTFSISPLVSIKFNSICIGTELVYHQNKYKLNGPNCKGVYKTQAFENKYGHDALIWEAYSDNKSDKPLFDKAQHAFVIKGGKVIRLK